MSSDLNAGALPDRPLIAADQEADACRCPQCTCDDFAAYTSFAFERWKEACQRAYADAVGIHRPVLRLVAGPVQDESQFCDQLDSRGMAAVEGHR